MIYKNWEANSKQWRKWFAWHPVRLSDSDLNVWLEFVERREAPDPGPVPEGSCWVDWQYRLPQKGIV